MLVAAPLGVCSQPQAGVSDPCGWAGEINFEKFDGMKVENVLGVLRGRGKIHCSEPQGATVRPGDTQRCKIGLLEVRA